jgi:hypothetical protein
MSLLRVEADRMHRSEQPDWHSGSELNDRARAFHDRFARQPPGIDEAKGIHTRYMREIEVFLRREGCCSRIEYTGSTYEGVKVPKEGDDLEFDIMVVMVTITTGMVCSVCNVTFTWCYIFVHA